MANRIVRRSTSAPRLASRGKTSDPKVILREAQAALSETMKNVMLTAADAIEAACPIRTGHLLSNFVLSTGTPYQGVDGSPEAVSYAAQDAGRAKVLDYDIARDGRIFIRNNVEYLQYQRPFVTEAIMSAASAVPPSRQPRARKALKAMARASFKRGA